MQNVEPFRGLVVAVVLVLITADPTAGQWLLEDIDEERHVWLTSIAVSSADSPSSPTEARYCA